MSGRMGSEGRLGVITGDIRRMMSLAMVWANTGCLSFGEGAGKRRRWQKVKEMMRKSWEGVWKDKATGLSVVWRGIA